MRRVRRLLAVAALAGASLLLPGCGTPAHRAVWNGEAGRAETGDLVRLHQARDAIDAMWERRQGDRLRRLLGDGVVFVPPGQPRVVGRDAVARWVEEALEGLEIRDVYVSEAFHLAGDWALETWSIDRRLRRDGAARRVRLKGVHLYRRDDEDRWRLAHRIWNEGPPHQAGERAE